MDDPLKDIEDKQGHIDIGTMSARIFEGAYLESDSILKAYFATAAFWAGTLGPQKDNEDD